MKIVPSYDRASDTYLVDWPGRPEGPVPTFSTFEAARAYAAETEKQLAARDPIEKAREESAAAKEDTRAAHHKWLYKIRMGRMHSSSAVQVLTPEMQRERAKPPEDIRDRMKRR